MYSPTYRCGLDSVDESGVFFPLRRVAVKANISMAHPPVVRRVGVTKGADLIPEKSEHHATAADQGLPADVIGFRGA